MLARKYVPNGQAQPSPSLTIFGPHSDLLIQSPSLQKHSRLFTHTDVRGVLMSCTQGRESIAVHEIISLLSQVRFLPLFARKSHT